MSTPALPPTDLLAETETAWGQALAPAGCSACGQTYLTPPGWIGQPCPHCARAPLAAQPARLRREAPEWLMPFKLKPAALPAIFQRFTQNIWLRCPELEAGLLARRARPLFWPMWLVDADLNGAWEAETGFDYQVQSSLDNLVDGQWRTRKVIETRIRWETRLGQIKRHYDNLAVPALTGQVVVRARAGEYPLKEAQPYQPNALGAAGVRLPDLPPEAAWPAAETQLRAAASEDCQTAAGAQHGREFKLQAEYQNLNWTQWLFPLYATYYTDDQGRRHTLFVNGVTGQIGGPRLASAKVGQQWAGGLGGLALASVLLAMLLAVIGALLPPVLLLGMLAGLAGLGLGVGALAAWVWPGQWNHGQKDEV